MNICSQLENSIIETSAKFFYAKGFHRTHVEDIVRELGMDMPTFHTYFANKEELCLAYLKRSNDSFFQNLIAHLDQIQDGRKKVIGIFENLELFSKMDGFNGCWGINMFSELHSYSEILSNQIIAQKKMLLEFIRELIVEIVGTKAKVQVDELAQKIYLLLESAVIESNLHNEEWPISRSKEMSKLLLEQV